MHRGANAYHKIGEGLRSNSSESRKAAVKTRRTLGTNERPFVAIPPDRSIFEAIGRSVFTRYNLSRTAWV